MALSRRVHGHISSKALGISSSQEPLLNLRQALNEYEDCLSNQEREEFRATGKPDVAAAINLTTLIDNTHSSHRRQCMGTRLMTFLESTQQFSTIVDTFVNSHPEIASLVWGGVRLALLTVNNVTTYFEKLSELFMKIGRTCPRFDKYGALYPDSIEVQTALCDYYATIIRLCRYSIESSRKPATTRLLGASYFPFEQEFGRYVQDLNNHSTNVMEAVDLASHQAQGVLLQLQKLVRDEQRQQGNTLAVLKDTLLQPSRRDLQELIIREERRTQEEKKLRLLSSFSNHKYQASYNQIRKDCTPGTCGWVFETNVFRSWRTGTLERIWCSGRLGSGKSVISACVMAHIMETKSSEDTACFFFCRHDDEESLKSRTIIGTIAKQLARNVPSNAFSELQEDDVEPSVIISFLTNNLSRTRQYFIIVDGLDECTQGEAMDAVEMLSKLQHSPLNIRVYCSTRPPMLTWLPSNFRPEEIINMDDHQHYKNLAQDMSRFIETNLQITNKDMEAKILQRLREGAEGMFLWVKLQMRTLHKSKFNNQVLATLQTLPPNLPETYERILKQIVNKDDPDLAKKILRWVAAAKRPLSIEELREAIAIEPFREARDVGKLIYDMVDAISCCGGLIYVNEENYTTHFTHSSVKQYLTSREVHETVEDYRIILGDADAEIGTACVTYLNYSMGAVARQKQIGSPFAEVPQFVQATSSSVGKMAIKLSAPRLHRRFRSSERTNRVLQETAGDTELRRRNREYGKYVFRPYAERFWLEHTKSRIDPKASRMYWGLWCNLVDRVGWLDKCFAIPWTGDEWNRRCENVLDWIVEQDHCSLAQFLVTSKPELSEVQLSILFEGAAGKNHPDLIDFYLDSQKVPQDLLDDALFEATRCGHLSMVEHLLSAHANADKRAFGATRPLCAAAAGGFLDIVVRLLRYNPEIDAIELIDATRTALQAAAENGHLEIVEILLEHKADINAAAADKNGRTALQGAAGEGHYSIVANLLRRQADVNAPAGKDGGRTALQAAVEKGHLFIITELLLGVCFKGYEKADVNAPAAKYNGRTALQAAAENGHTFLVAYLLGEKADVNAPGAEWSHGRTALQAAAENNHLDVVTMLLTAKEKANVNAAAAGHNGGRTALQAAAGAGHLRIIDRLLEEGADCNADPCDTDGRTALQAAAEGGHANAVRKLLEAGAAVNSAPSDQSGLTALQAAAKSGELDLVELLLSENCRADLHAPAGKMDGRTALQAAAENGHLRVVNRLLQEGAEINASSCEYSGRTALQAAAGGGHLAVVRYLLQEGADINAASGPHNGRTAIQAAAEGGHEAVLKELLQAGAIINTPIKDDGATALRAAAQGGFLNLVRILLKEGATDEAEEGTHGGQTVLYAAFIGGHRDLAKYLQEAGYSDVRYFVG